MAPLFLAQHETCDEPVTKWLTRGEWPGSRRAIAMRAHRRYPMRMTNRIAIGLGLLIVLLVVADFVFQDGSGSLFLARKLTELIKFLAFWR